MTTFDEDDELLAELAAIRPDQTDVFARSVHASIRRNLIGETGEPFRLGRFTVLEPLGGGGMGVVFVAYDPVLDRKIALKVLHNRGDRGRREVLREGRALARLKHPNVVAVFEVGELDDRVFVAMEYVDGHNLREWLRQPRTTAAILARLVEAGRGLAAAHAVELVHRDFKPENVVIDGNGHARVIDFGLARPIAELPEPAQSAAVAPATAASVHGGTPAYMAPERLAGAAGDHRSDQYSFCVTAWEALFGARPADARARVAQAQGRSVPGWLRKVLERGLSAAPGDRYPTTEALLAALRADPTRRRRVVAAVVVAGLAVAGWFGVRDYREAQTVASCEADGASMAGAWRPEARTKLRDGMLASGVAYAETAADKVVPYFVAQAEALTQARTEGCLNARVRGTWDEDTLARSVWCLEVRRLEFEALLDALSQPKATSVQAAVDAAAALSPTGPCLDASQLARLPPLPPDPERHQAVRRQLARAGALRTAGDYDEGLREAREALAAAEDLDWPALTADARRRVGMLLVEGGKYQEAEPMLEDAYFEAARAGALEVTANAAVDLAETVGYRQARYLDGLRWSRLAEVAAAAIEPEDRLSTRRSEIVSTRAKIHEGKGDYAEAQALLERVLAMDEKLLGPEHPHVANTLNNLANVHWATRAYAEARPLYERALAIHEKTLGSDHPHLATTLNNLANIHLATGSYDEGRAILERVVATEEKVLGPEHPDFAISLHNLASAYRLKGAYAEARVLYERTLAIREKVLGPEHPSVAQSLNSIAGILSRTGAYEEARVMHARALALREKALGPDHPDVASSLHNLAGVHRSMGAYGDAKPLFERALAIWEQAFGPEHVSLAAPLESLALVHVALGEYDRASPLAERALAVREKKLGPDHPDVAFSLVNLALVRASTGAYEEAEALYRRALAIDEAKLGPDHPEVAYTLIGLAEVALARDRPAEAVALAERSTGILAGREAPADKLADSRFVLARALVAALADKDRALALARQARDGLRAVNGKSKELAQVEAFLTQHEDRR
ncbi:serine/threonine-protein kinase [Nannocystis pusilla]|uniref:Tetratricopeptide repeat protein n=1 Tax=Nannocystis pusilla TaxID=889268 RepID=A0ABS7TXU5_9BACT|nr:serine/threonine-protein kinase [Nannocystis pusilla]MBZ5712976.1 tetratricopeptide repeat protein [Nannocystis pusilla]